MKHYQRKAVCSDLCKWCHFAKGNDEIEVCEWTNEEGIDVSISDRHFSLTYGELTAVEVLARVIGKE